jgi:protein-tyrosine phosphatase
MRHYLQQRGLTNRILVDSAGIVCYNRGGKADRRMRRHAWRRGYRIISRSRPVRRKDLEFFDLVIAMDGENLADLKRIHAKPPAEVKMLSDFLDDTWPFEVPDPYNGDPIEFERVLDMMEAACPGIVEYLLETKSPKTTTQTS